MNDPAASVPDPFWADRLASSSTDKELMGYAWSYLLATLAATPPSNAVRRNELHRDVAALLIEAAKRA
ncbi:hypothetical protein GCM10025864_44910 [Luteimicrobium album]|uniref:Uncharacterized protein n=1 Tax=Luteimicrobium album TaxID=1054550 RepID=A0ABQ6IAE0_9MICO|nr:hypothetical protein [Luteimicrobium album]GMA22265.1 hypothetical protein GCM10025864_00240 [Luteimicrobium album]GMA26670.1 hypothetical protein GCM10025864_44290 [Luteimicrobium album]GMA26732.1 hypothetical protein GCM10025864_44910 [Luteimicrobium album]